MESSYSLGGNVTGEATMESSMDIPWNIKHRGIIWSCNPIPGLRSKENHHSKWHVYLNFQGSTVYNSQDIKIHQNVHWHKYEDYIIDLYTKILLSHKTEWSNHIGSSMDEPRNYNSMWGKSETNILRYHVQVGSIKSHQWTNVHNRNSLRKPNSDYQKKKS